MRYYAKISTSLWDSQKFGRLNDDRARLLYLYFHTNPKANAVGCYVIKPGHIAADTGWDIEAVAKAIDSLSKASLIDWNAAENVVRIVGFLDHDEPTNGRHAIYFVKTALGLPDCQQKILVLEEVLSLRHVQGLECKDEFDEALATMKQSLSKGSGEAFESLSALNLPLPHNPLPPKPPTGGVTFSEDFEEFWKEYPEKVGKKAAFRAWKKAKDRPPITGVLSAISRYKSTKPPDRAWCNPATWLNQGRWADAPAATQPADAGSTTPAEPPKDLQGWRLAAWKAIGGGAFKSWIEPGLYVRNGTVITATFPTKFHADWVKTNYENHLLAWMKTDRIDIAVAREDAQKPVADGQVPQPAPATGGGNSGAGFDPVADMPAAMRREQVAA